jgi:beta-ribofuranosylaminobenzene 5'-phosphate synthase
LGEEADFVKVIIRTPARLHLGMLDLRGDLGRRFGSIGVAIQRPNVVVEASRAASWQVDGVEVERTQRVIDHFCRQYPLPAAARVCVQESIPAHVGLGSGTQLALAIGLALARLYELEIPLQEMAHYLGRGIHSGIGVAAFHSGGFVVDGGKGMEGGGVPPLLIRYPFPEGWFFVVAIPEPERKGVSGRDEAGAFRDLPSPSPDLVGCICRLLIMKMLPALIERRIVDFGEALTEIQRLVGDCFASQQVGGRFALPLAGQVIEHMLEQGAYGAGQSSWGPTVYGLVEGEREGERLMDEVRRFLRRHPTAAVFAVAADNVGHTVQTYS